ncbi:hypothetical protein GGR56DRAFT_162810 [Xylariaceae sp. FL0804]|nr:hypothetical protein GGR56DRAFT_162810 [Xylariaceae sp. FL0804]
MPLQIPHPDHPLHLYRHLLRESTYLPQLVRPWVASRIHARFRECRYKRDPRACIKQAHSQLRFLRSANSGHVERFTQLCYLATGRRGKRRRELIDRTFRVDPAADTADTTETERALRAGFARDSEQKPAVRDWLDTWSIAKIMSFAKTQNDAQNTWRHNSPRVMRKALEPKLATEDSFGRPIAAKLYRSRLKKSYQGILYQMLPPLPRGEWDWLAALARGETSAHEAAIPPRRPVALSGSASTKRTSWDWTRYAIEPARKIERANSRSHMSSTGAEDHDPRGPGRPIGTKVLSRKKLQSIYTQVWETCAVLRAETKSGAKWEWGQRTVPMSRPSAGDLEIFRGVSSDGKVNIGVSEAAVPSR